MNTLPLDTLPDWAPSLLESLCGANGEYLSLRDDKDVPTLSRLDLLPVGNHTTLGRPDPIRARLYAA